MAEEGRVAARNIRRDAIHHLKELEKGGDVGSDDVHRAEDRLQKLTDAHTAAIDSALKGQRGRDHGSVTTALLRRQRRLLRALRLTRRPAPERPDRRSTPRTWP